MWVLEPGPEFVRRVKRYEKKNPRELKAVTSNLDVLVKALNEGANPLKLPFGFLHREQRGVLAIDQSRGGGNLAETRLYLYLEAGAEVVHLITLGDKRTQKADVNTASAYVAALLKTKE